MFDLKVHLRDPKTGKMTGKQPYRMHISRDNGTLFERDGMLYYPDGSEFGPAPSAKKAEPAKKPGAVQPKKEEPALVAKRDVMSPAEMKALAAKKDDEE